jgi:hypothetical protein
MYDNTEKRGGFKIFFFLTSKLHPICYHGNGLHLLHPKSYLACHIPARPDVYPPRISRQLQLLLLQYITTILLNTYFLMPISI